MKWIKWVGILIVLLGLYGVRDELGGEPYYGDYTQTTGTVEQVVIKKRSEDQFQVKVLFSYRIGQNDPVNRQNDELLEKTFKSVRVPELNDPYPSEAQARVEAAKYWEGRTMTVFYDAYHPTIATTQLTDMNPMWIVLLAGVLLVIIGFMLRPKKNRIALFALMGLSASLMSSPLAQAFDEDTFIKLAETVEPSVVNISTYANVRVQRGDPNDLFRQFFEEFYGRQGMPSPFMRPPTQPDQPRESMMALGTGFIIDSSGLILTNNHVIGQADEVKVSFTSDENEVPVHTEIIGRDPELDLALLKVKTSKKLKSISLGDSSVLKKGQMVMAVGNPFGQGQSVSTGIVSGLGREAPGLLGSKYIQTDAAINPGNSGGPLVNLNGEVIGINNAIDARAQGIGFAIPINAVKKVLAQLKTKGEVERGYIGIGIGELTPEIAQQIRAPIGLKAPVVTNVSEGDPADEAGIEPYDVILEVNGKTTKSPNDLLTEITGVSVGDTARLRVLRKGKEKTISVKVGSRSSLHQVAKRHNSRPSKRDSQSVAGTGMVVETLGDSQRRALGISKGVSGVVVSQVQPGSPANDAGLLRGDVILEVDRKKVENSRSFERIVKADKSYLLRILRSQGGLSVYMVVVLDLKTKNS